MTSPLENLAGAGKPLAAEPPDTNEIAGLLRSGHARLAKHEGRVDVEVGLVRDGVAAGVMPSELLKLQISLLF